MTGPTPNRIDRLARRFAGRELRTGPRIAGLSGETSFDRRSLLGAGALGVLAFSLRGVPSAAAAPEVAAGCPGGSLKACYATVEKNFDKLVRQFCDTLKDKAGDPFGTASYSCYVDWYSSRLDARKDCRASCSKPKKKSPAAPPGSGGGGGSAPPGGGGHTPTCGQVDCVQGNLCCKSDAGPICCAVCCSKSGGCGSSASDCG
ncbi:MAG TPA: hypothetical protein VH816_13835 [Gaiellaceae bacterium]|jgi:hypothetical protein